MASLISGAGGQKKLLVLLLFHLFAILFTVPNSINLQTRTGYKKVFITQGQMICITNCPQKSSEVIDGVVPCLPKSMLTCLIVTVDLEVFLYNVSAKEHFLVYPSTYKK